MYSSGVFWGLSRVSQNKRAPSCAKLTWSCHGGFLRLTTTYGLRSYSWKKVWLYPRWWRHTLPPFVLWNPWKKNSYDEGYITKTSKKLEKINCNNLSLKKINSNKFVYIIGGEYKTETIGQMTSRDYSSEYSSMHPHRSQKI